MIRSVSFTSKAHSEIRFNEQFRWVLGSRWLMYLTGYDPAKIYVMKQPEAGSDLQWIDTNPLNIAGQGIA